MAWRWRKGSAYLLPPSLHNHSLTLTSGYETEIGVTVPQMSSYDSYRTLRAYISPSGRTDKAFCEVIGS